MVPQNTLGTTGLGYLWNDIVGRNQQREQNEWNRQQALEQYQREVEMWKMQNEYNSPKSQMERYQAAGLNPNLIYSSGNASAGNASGYPSYQPAQGVGRPSGMETLSKIVSVIGTLIGLKGQLASADAAAARAKQIAALTPLQTNLSKARYWSYLGSNPFVYFNMTEPGGDWSFHSVKDLYQGDPGLFLSPGFARALRSEMEYGILDRYQDSIMNENLIRLRGLNSLLSLDKQFYKLDKWIGYGTDALGSLLSLGSFGLGLKNFGLKSKYFRSVYGY